MIVKLIFIYNADADLGSKLLDGAHKIWSPSTYNCSLCSLTFGAFSEKRVWKKFREQSKIEMEFLHKDEFTSLYASKFNYRFSFPIVLAKTQNNLEVFVKTEELNDIDSLDSLIDLIEARL